MDYTACGSHSARRRAERGNAAVRKFALLMIFPLVVFPAVAKRVTVAQLEQVLVIASAAHKSDADMVRQIDAMDLSERLTETTLDRLTAQLALGAQAALALRLLADQSAFLNPPNSELLPTAAPDDAAQQRMLDAARNYVTQTLTRLPNFLATRTTNRYDDTPKAINGNEWPVRAGLHLVDSSSREISIRDEQDMHASAKGSAFWQPQGGMVSGGEFGTTLGMILTDTVKGKVIWDHWERTAAGAAGVFHYSVPKAASHYEVIGLQKPPKSLGAAGTPNGGSRGTSGSARGGASNASLVRVTPGYHGSLWLEPATGTILRVTVEADGKDQGPFRRADILVQYGPVQIGGSRFICPLRSIALSEAFLAAGDLAEEEPTQWLNETLFTSYHRFGSSVRLLKDTATQ
jgi:hypothetical protein